MTSDAKIAANRQNACKSSGPRTERGKTKSSYNAVKFGVYAKIPVLPGEDLVAFRKLEKSNLEFFAPIGPLENMLVRQLTTEQWRLRRIERTEVVLQARVKTAQIQRLFESLDDRQALVFCSVYGKKFGAEITEELHTRIEILAHPLTKLATRIQVSEETKTQIPKKTDEDVKSEVDAKLRDIQELDGTLIEVADPATDSAPQIYLVNERRSAMRVYVACAEKLRKIQEERLTLSLPLPATGSASNAERPKASSPNKPANQNRRKPTDNSSTNSAISPRRKQKLENLLCRLRARSGT